MCLAELEMEKCEFNYKKKHSEINKLIYMKEYNLN